MTDFVTPKRSLLLGAVLAPFVAPLIIALWMVAQLTITGGGWSPGGAQYLSLIFLVGTPVAFVTVWCAGLPLVAFLRSRNALGSVALCASSLVLGPIVMLVFMTIIGGAPSSLAKYMSLLGVGAILGLSVAMVFCLLSGIPLRPRSSTPTGK